MDKTGDTVDTYAQYYEKETCEDIRQTWTQARGGQLSNGQYLLTPRGHNTKRVLVNCYFGSTPAITFLPYIGTQYYRSPVNGDCKKALGQDAKLTGKSQDLVDALALSDFMVELARLRGVNNAQLADDFFSLQDARVCTIPAGTSFERQTSRDHTSFDDEDEENTATRGKAEVGVYKIRYQGTDEYNLKSNIITRTVIVKDTLPPVIRLYKAQEPQTFDHVLFEGKASDPREGMNGEENTPWRKNDNPLHDSKPGVIDLMAETTSANGWFIGAIACAVTGMALLGFSNSKATTSVPV